MKSRARPFVRAGMRQRGHGGTWRYIDQTNRVRGRSGAVSGAEALPPGGAPTVAYREENRWCSAARAEKRVSVEESRVPNQMSSHWDHASR